MSFKEVNQVKFELTSATTWGVKKDKYSGYSVPVALDDGTKSPLYGNTIYLKSKNLSAKQKSDLYNKGKASIEVHFMVKGVYTKNDISYLTLRITKLRKTEDVSESDSCPED